LVFSSERERESAEQALTNVHVQTKRYFLPAHRQTAYAGSLSVGLPRTDDVHARLLCVPLFESLVTHDIERIAGVVEEAVS
ncbi:MAG: DegT/DnrJ/EryC1/StrS family aminotransferase, partial [Chloroflexi bacterium]|nr:DegT/DnrJ/EryC1/StrS family aminotransferase [Chloroflexota bacterium]